MHSITAERQPDGSTIVVGDFPSRILIAREFLQDCDGSLLRRRFRTVDIQLANGRAVYRLVSWSNERWGYWATRLYVEPKELAGE